MTTPVIILCLVVALDVPICYQAVGPNAEPPGPKWLRSITGDDFFVRVTRVTLELSGTITTTEIERLLKDLGRLPKLTTLNVRYADDHVVRLIGMHLHRLQTLHIPSSGIRDDSLILLHELTNLRELGLWNTRITGTGLAHLAELRKLETLLLQRADLTDAGLQNVSTLENIRVLNLNGNRGYTKVAIGARFDNVGLLITTW